jgi:hypothetical protein
MSDAAIFVAVFVALFIIRIVVATAVFLCILPDGDRCPNCNMVTIRLQSFGAARLLPWFRNSWCLTCGWRGLLRRRRPIPNDAPVRAELTKLR